MAKKKAAQAVERAAAKGAGKAPPGHVKGRALSATATPVPMGELSETLTLVQHPAVRIAAIRLVLMREAGLRITDLVVQRKRPPSVRRKAVQAPALRGGDVSSAPSVSSACPQLVTPAERPIDRAARLAGVGRRGQVIAGAVARHAPLAGPVIVPEGVKVTLCPGGRDTRFTVDPDQPCEGGGFLSEWRALRAEGGK